MHMSHSTFESQEAAWLHGHRSPQWGQPRGATVVCRGDRQGLGAYTPGAWWSLSKTGGQNCPAGKNTDRVPGAVSARGTRSFLSPAGNSHSEHGGVGTRHDRRTPGCKTQPRTRASRGHAWSHGMLGSWRERLGANVSALSRTR